MSTFLRHCSSYFVGAVVAMAVLVVSPGKAHGQAGAIGARGGQTVPTVSTTPTLPSTPVLPSSLNLPTEATSSLLKGLDASGTALRPGMGWLVSDLTHQGITGRQLADILMPLRPGMKVLFVSGHTDDAVVRHGVREENVAFLQKPFTAQVLARKVREVLDE